MSDRPCLGGVVSSPLSLGESDRCSRPRSHEVPQPTVKRHLSREDGGWERRSQMRWRVARLGVPEGGGLCSFVLARWWVARRDPAEDPTSRTRGPPADSRQHRSGESRLGRVRVPGAHLLDSIAPFLSRSLAVSGRRCSHSCPAPTPTAHRPTTWRRLHHQQQSPPTLHQRMAHRLAQRLPPAPPSRRTTRAACRRATR